jgi:hypothetical protein
MMIKFSLTSCDGKIGNQEGKIAISNFARQQYKQMCIM